MIPPSELFNNFLAIGILIAFFLLIYSKLSGKSFTDIFSEIKKIMGFDDE